MAEIKVISGIVDIPLDQLHHQYIPKCTPLELYPGADPMHVLKSHHVRLLLKIIKYGLNKKVLKKTKYWQERRHRYNIGMTRWTDGVVWEHIKKRWDTYCSLKKHGYDKKKGDRKPVLILKQPFWETRFNWESGFLNGPEVWDGMGRVSSAIALRWKTIPGRYCEDAKPGACEFDKGLNKIKKRAV